MTHADYYYMTGCFDMAERFGKFHKKLSFSKTMLPQSSQMILSFSFCVVENGRDGGIGGAANTWRLVLLLATG